MARSKPKASALFHSYEKLQIYSHRVDFWTGSEDHGSRATNAPAKHTEFASWPTLPLRSSPHDALTLSLSHFSRSWTLPYGPKVSGDRYAVSFQKLVNALFNNLRNNVKVSHSAFQVFKSKAQQLKDTYQRLSEKFEGHKERGELFYDDMDNPHIGQYRIYEQILRVFENVPPLDRVNTAHRKTIGRILTLLQKLDQRYEQQPLYMETWSSAVLANCKDEIRLMHFAKNCQPETLYTAAEHGHDDPATYYYDAKEVQEGQNGSDVSGQLSLKLWRRSAGRSKSWRRCPKTRLDDSEQNVKNLQLSYHDGHRFFQPPLWIPSAYIHSRGSEQSARLARYVQKHRSRGQTKYRDINIDYNIEIHDVGAVVQDSQPLPALYLDWNDNQCSVCTLRRDMSYDRSWRTS